MRVQRNYDNTPEQEDYQLLPDGQYMFEISEVQDKTPNGEDKVSSNGDPMPNICLRCIEEGEYENSKVWDNILIPDEDSPAYKIIGRTKRFLHAIGEPYQGNFDVDTDDWINKTVEAKIGRGKGDYSNKNIVLRYILSEKQQDTPNDSRNTAGTAEHEEQYKKEQSDLPW